MLIKGLSCAELSEPSEWNIEETIFNISSLDPSLGPHVENFRSHEIDGKRKDKSNWLILICLVHRKSVVAPDV